MESCGISSKLKEELPCDLAVPFMGICPKVLKVGSQTDISTPLITAGLFTIAKRW
jgi:hypothetical protein